MEQARPMTSTAVPEAQAAIQEAGRLIRQGLDVSAAALLARRMSRAPDPAVQAALTDLAQRSGQPTARLAALSALAKTQGDDIGFRRRFGALAIQANDFTLAADAYQRAGRLPGGTIADRMEAARAAYLANDLKTARTLYQQAMRTPAVHADAAAGLADVLIALRRSDEATAILEAALARAPGHVGLLSRLCALKPADDRMGALKAAAGNLAAPSYVRAEAAYALAGACDRMNDPQGAMAWARLGARLAAEPTPAAYDPAREDAAAALMLAVHDAGGPDVKADEALEPLVIVGMPRSGTSLTESILGAHPMVAAGGERMELALAGREIEIIAGRMGAKSAATALQAREAAMRAEIAGRYRAAGLNRQRVTDKMPLNLLYVGVIARLFPGARFIHVRRDPRETCLSIHLLNFAGAYGYAGDLGQTAHAWTLSERLMADWKARLGDRVLTLDHEALCEAPDEEGRRLFAFCGLDWTADYLRPERRRAPMRTFSALQVGAPITRRPNRWPQYKPWITPLIEAFGET